MISPTGSFEIRGTDKHGSGAFKSGRGWRPHYGVDLVCDPGQDIIAPHSGLVRREITCYTDSNEFKGIEIIGDDCITQVLYMIPLKDIIGREVQQGDLIGTAQDISRRYEGITKHCHWQCWCNPILFI